MIRTLEENAGWMEGDGTIGKYISKVPVKSLAL
jgi:hypothetical protein